MNDFKKTALIALVLCVAFFGTVQAASAAEFDDLPACEGDTVSGSLVHVDSEAGFAVIDDGEALCRVALNSDSGNQITDLFEQQFGTTDSEGLTELLEGSLESRTAYLVFDDASGEWLLAAEGDEGAVMVLISAVIDNGDGTYSFEFTAEGVEEPILVTSDDAELAADLQSAIDSAFVEFNLQTNEDGSTSIADAGALAQQYHEEGMGFGVLVKLFSMAQDMQANCASEDPEAEPSDEETEVELSNEACLTSLESLVAEFNSGVGLGKLFQEYGRPSLLGVGHLRHADDADGNGNGHGNGNGQANGNSADKLPGYCKDHGNNGNGNGNGQGNGNGNGNGNGKGNQNKQENCEQVE